MGESGFFDQEVDEIIIRQAIVDCRHLTLVMRYNRQV